MMLARITPGPDHSDLRTFECPKCNYVHKVVVEDPLKSAGMGSGITVDYTRLGNWRTASALRFALRKNGGEIICNGLFRPTVA